MLERGEEDEQKQRELGADGNMHPTVETTHVISADVCPMVSVNYTAAEVWNTCNCWLGTSAFKALYWSNRGGIWLADYDDRLSKGFITPHYDWIWGWVWAAYLLEP